MSEFKSEIITASKDLTVIEAIKLKDLGDAENINGIVDAAGSLDINVKMFATIHVHNERSDDKDYKQLVIMADDGRKYYTGSKSFMEAFEALSDDLADNDIFEFTIHCFGRESKNYKGRYFLTCSLA